MSKYDFKVGNAVSNAAGPMVTQPSVTYHGVDDAALAQLLKLTDANAADMHRLANKGGPITITGSRETVALDGGILPVGSTAQMTVTGITYHGLVDIEAAILKRGLEITNGLGRQHAAAKEGKKP